MFLGGGIGVALLGNATSVALPNSFLGLRVPHADRSPDVWRRTQLMGSRALVGTGTATIVSALVLPSTVTSRALMVLLTFSSLLNSLPDARDASEERTDIETLDDGSTLRRTGPHASGASPPPSALLPAIASEPWHQRSQPAPCTTGLLRLRWPETTIARQPWRQRPQHLRPTDHPTTPPRNLHPGRGARGPGPAMPVVH
ncbi:SdpI family protein [Actinomyces provencensis]|uniref:SdpI family protein n=1 Tax=Actinomyces provencensis TaxID=1720198 RepID=UPI00096A8963